MWEQIKLKSILQVTVLFVSITSIVTVNAETAFVSKDTVMKAEPYRDADDVLGLSIGEQVSLVKRKGGWSKIGIKEHQGWVRTMRLRLSSYDSSENLSSISGLVTGRGGSGNVIATTGIRGLDEEQLASAKLNEKQLVLMDSYKKSVEEAKYFARNGNLIARDINYLQ